MGHDQLRHDTGRLRLVGRAERSSARSYGVRAATDLDEIRRRLLLLGRSEGLTPADADSISHIALASVLTKSEKDPAFFDRPDDVWGYAMGTALNQARSQRR